MKTISGFISNSSSSSFILDFKKEINTKEDLGEFILKDRNIFFGRYEEAFSKKEVIEFILKRIEPRNRKEVIKYLSNSNTVQDKLFDFEYSKDWKNSFCNKTWLISDNMVYKMSFHDAIEHLAEKYVKQNMKDLLEKLKHSYYIDIDDKDRLGANLESGDAFNDYIVAFQNNH